MCVYVCVCVLRLSASFLLYISRMLAKLRFTATAKHTHTRTRTHLHTHTHTHTHTSFYGVQRPPKISSNKQQTWKNKSNSLSLSLPPSPGTREGIQRMLPVTIKLLDITHTLIHTHTILSLTHTPQSHWVIQITNREGGMSPQRGITSSIAPHTPFIYWLMRSRYTHT